VVPIKREAEDINSYDLRPVGGYELPHFTAGAHIDLHLPSQLIRSYSLVNSQSERHRYVVAIARDPKSRGGSNYIHQAFQVGANLTISPPRNNFVLAENAEEIVFIAGGIGCATAAAIAGSFFSSAATASQKKWSVSRSSFFAALAHSSAAAAACGP
jgi:vanillate O-demethylase ferredoxin subunit